MMLKLLLAALLTTAIAVAVDLSPRIAGGTPAASGDFSFYVSVIIGKSHTCGGSLLGPDTVLTAAHCIQEGHPISSYKVRAGSLDCTTGGTVVGVRSMTPHSSYSDTTMTDDIAIFKLSEAIPESSSIGYAKVRQQGADPPAQANATIVGCGAQSLWADRAAFPLKLQKARATIVGRNECGKQMPGVTEGTICVGAPAGPGLAAPRPPGLFDWTGGSAMPKQIEARGVCSGDSGGPVVVNGEVVGVASFVLAQIASGGVVCQASHRPAVATRVDKYVDAFIKPALQVNHDKEASGGQPQLPPSQGSQGQGSQGQGSQGQGSQGHGSQGQGSQGQGSQGLESSQRCPSGCVSVASLLNQLANRDCVTRA